MPSFPKLTNKGLAATSTPAQFSFNTSSPAPAPPNTTTNTQQPTAQKSLFPSLQPANKPPEQIPSPSNPAPTAKQAESTAPTFSFNLGKSPGNEQPKQGLFGAVPKFEAAKSSERRDG